MDFTAWFSYYMKGYYGFRWDQNVESWLTKGRQCLKKEFLLVRYEDLRSATIEELNRVCNFFGIDADQNALHRAVKSATIEKGKQWERRYLGPIKKTNSSFYRGGCAGEWKNLFSEEQKRLFLKVSEQALRLGGYL
ncbi:hypothetical protein ES703_108817 [subsurface metagenome]